MSSLFLFSVHSLSAECGLFRAPSLFPCVHRPSVECGSVFADLAPSPAVGGLASVELSCSLSLSCFKHVWHRFLGCLSLLCGASHALFLFLSSSSVVGSRSATSCLSTALLSARGRGSACAGPCESSSGSSVEDTRLRPIQLRPVGRYRIGRSRHWPNSPQTNTQKYSFSKSYNCNYICYNYMKIKVANLP